MPGYLTRLLPFALATVVLLQTAGCESTSPFRGGSPASSEKRQAQQLIDRGDYAGAAALYESAAATASGDKRTFLLLSAAENYLRARDAISAQGAFAQTRRPTSGNLALHYRIVDAELAMARSQPEEAERALGPTPSLAAPSSLRLSYYRAQAKILSALNRRAPQADARMRLSDLATDNAERYANQQQLLRLLATLNEEERAELRRYGHPHVQGWIALADALTEAGNDPQQRDARFSEWRAQYPNHPSARGLERPPSGGKLTYLAGSNTTIGALLPLEGPYARAAESIRDGIMAATFSLPSDQQPTVRFYDTSNAQAAAQAYTQATSEGAAVVIGPLTKDAVSSVKTLGSLSVPTVALNHTSDAFAPTVPGLFQFALSPEDEGRQVADQAFREGFFNPAILVPTSGWGSRYSEGFQQQWEGLGGLPATVTEYNPEEHHLAEPIKSAYANSPGFFYAIGKPLKSRQLRTQVQYFGSAEIPVFLTGQSVQSINSRDNLDLDGTRIPAMPWVLAGPGQVPQETAATEEETGDASDSGAPVTTFTSSDDPLQAVRAGAAQAGEGYGAFFAMGYDAVQIALNLPSLSTGYGVVEGATGRLTADATGVVHREPTWITFKNGRAVKLNDN